MNNNDFEFDNMDDEWYWFMLMDDMLIDMFGVDIWYMELTN